MKLTKFVATVKLGALALLAWQPVAHTLASQITPVKVAELSWPQYFNALRVQGDYLYTTGNGFQVFDISNRTNPVNVATVSLWGGGGNLSIAQNYAYVLEATAATGSSLRIFDISTPAHPVETGLLSGYHFSISVSGGYVFLDSGIYDISDPVNPIALGQLPGVGPTVGTGNFVCVAGNYAYVAVNWVGLVVFDISNPANPVQVGQASSGMYAWEVALSGNYAYIAAATNCGLAAFNISTPTNPVALPCWVPGSQRITLSGNYAFLDWAGLTILDTSNPTNLTVAAQFEPYPTYAGQAAVTGNHAYVAESDYQTGHPFLGVYRLDVPPPPLSIRIRQTNYVALAWPAPTIAFALQETQNLDNNSWVTLTNVPDVVNSMNQVILPTPPQNTFYRLAASAR